MAKGIISATLVVFLVAVIGYQKFGVRVESPRDVVKQGIHSAKQTRTLTPDEEQFLTVQLSIVDYTAKHLSPPDSLTDLIPAYFDAVPVDPVSKQPYRYAREGARYRLERPADVQMAKADTGAEKAATTVDSKAQLPGLEPLEEEEEQFLYDPSGKRDPFRPFDLSGRSMNDDPSLTPLERYTLSQLRLTATAQDSKGEPTALVEDDTGKGYTVRIGTKIGSNSGVVIAIDSQAMKILERSVDIAGVESENVVEMKIQSAVDERKKGRRPAARKK